MDRYTKIFIAIGIAFIIFLGGIVAIKTYSYIETIIDTRYKDLEYN